MPKKHSQPRRPAAKPPAAPPPPLQQLRDDAVAAQTAFAAAQAKLEEAEAIAPPAPPVARGRTRGAMSPTTALVKATAAPTSVKPKAAGGAPGGPGDEPDEGMSFGRFLSEVSEAMVAAQQHLDLQSEGYLHGSSGSRPLPTMFRLPRLKAQAKFAVDQSEGKKIGLVLFSSSKSNRTQQEHSVDFELVAVPPPPESGLAPEPFVPLLPRLELILQRADRLAWIELLLNHAAAAAALGVAPGDAAEKHPEIALWRIVRPSEKLLDGLFLAGQAPGGAAPSKLAFVLVTLPQPAIAATVKEVRPLNLGGGFLDAWLAGFLAATGRRQTEMFTGRKSP